MDLKLIKQLRDETAASIADCRRALDEGEGDYQKALAWLKKRMVEKAEKKSDRRMIIWTVVIIVIFVTLMIIVS
jgi:translation elongation factor EF-Ts